MCIRDSCKHCPSLPALPEHHQVRLVAGMDTHCDCPFIQLDLCHIAGDHHQVIQGLSLIHISEPTRLLSISYAVFCLKKKKKFENRTGEGNLLIIAVNEDSIVYLD
eukprot:TRINITY_DN12857_c0_g1_i1.p1 TRINITY_DN12857_c0_g1~~TRINITY_DN12857_c0_g1_i1.p1  ORF type:complete len:106 (-),score=25.31 TRINITY_DN12857_c0_g1_i1:30-347(-)